MCILGLKLQGNILPTFAECKRLCACRCICNSCNLGSDRYDFCLRFAAIAGAARPGFDGQNQLTRYKCNTIIRGYA